MPTTLQLRRGTTSELSSVTGAVGEIFVDTTKDTVVVMDGITEGGFPLAKESDIPTSLSNLTNDSGFITSSALNGYVTTNALTTAVSQRQAALVSGTNIKTINGTSLLGSGDISISGGSGGTSYNQSLNTTNNVRFNNLIIGSDTAPTTFRFFESNNLSDRINLANADNAQDGGVVQRSPIAAITGGNAPTSAKIPLLTAARLNGYVSYIEVVCTATYLRPYGDITSKGFKVRGYASKVNNILDYYQIGQPETLFNFNTSGEEPSETVWLSVGLSNDPVTNTIEISLSNANSFPGTKWVWGGEVTVISCVTTPATESEGEGGEGGGEGGEGGGFGGEG